MTELRTGIVVPAFNEENNIRNVLSSLSNQDNCENTKVFLIDNMSTDRTREVAEEYALEHPSFSISILDESEQGTGCASDTGFLKAIDEGYQLIARTDADTLPDKHWISRLADTMESNPDIQLLGGARLPLKDEFYKLHDSFLWPIGLALGDLACRLSVKQKIGSGVVAGCNMITRAEAYTRVGGFPRTKIEDADEDAIYVAKIIKEFGPEALDIQRDAKVYTSMRRVRSLGYIGMFTYRFSSLVSDGTR